MDSDDDNVVTYGTPIVTDDNEEEVPRKKPIPIEQQIVTDARGLRRFHGAFTGGFSAGYFNSVGSKEGWAPSTFVSSRSSRIDKSAQRPEEFMDDEDLGAFGIAPRGFRINKKFSEETVTENKRKRPHLGLSDGPIPGIAPLRDLIVPVRESVGVRLLRKMGWKPGQGIGPRVSLKEKLKKNKTKGKQSCATVYGCSLPHNIVNEDEDENEDELHGITVAPDDVKMDSFKTKEDWHGLGYIGLNKNPVLSTFRDGNRRALPFVDKSKKLAIAGEAFGVGAYEDDDESIYTVEDMSQYDFELGGDSSLHKHQAEKGKKMISVGYIGKELEGFHLSSKPLPPKKFYPPPVLPKHFQPFHKLCSEGKTSVATGGSSGLDRHRMTALDRTVVISNEPPSSTSGSIFNHLRPDDRARLQGIRKTTASSSVLPNPATACKLGDSSASPRSTSTSGSGFRPFAQDEDKQKRYESYLKLKESNKEGVFSKCQPLTMTEWEKQREQEEFRRSAVIYKPLSYSMASRFVSAKHPDTTDQAPNDSVPTNNKLSDYQPNALKPVREKLEWHPDRMLCRRFNIPNPYPDSTLVGVPKVKHDKYSIFSFPSVPEASMAAAEIITDISGESIAHSEDITSRNSSPTTLDELVKSQNQTEQGTPNLFSCLEKESNLAIPENKQMDSKQVIEKDAESKRPPMDLFKAIFCDTDSESNSSADEMVKEQIPGDSNSKEFSLMDVIKKPDIPSEPSATSADKAARASNTLLGVFSNIDFDSLNKNPEKGSLVLKEKKLSSIAVKVTPNTNEANTIGCSATVCENTGYYGPSLPPNLIQAFHESVNTDTESRHDPTNVKKTKSKHKHKKKHKHKSTSKHHQRES